MSIATLRLRTATIALVCGLALAGCDTAEERAEKHYQNALALLEAGDPDRAILELRNVFELDPQHRDARSAIARTEMVKGNLGGAFGQYLRLVEQYPNDVEGRLMLSELGILLDNWDAAEPHAEALVELAPDAPRAQVVSNTIAYRQAVLSNEEEARRELGQVALELKPTIPNSIINRTVLVDSLILDGEFSQALSEVNEALEISGDNRRLFQMKVNVLNQLELDEELEQTLRTMVTTFPEDESIPGMVISFYNSRNNLDGAEDFLRSQVTSGVPDDGARVTLVRFLTETRSREVALETVDSFIEEGTNEQLFRSLRGTLLFDSGERDEGIQLLQQLVEGAEATDQTRDITVTLARMLLTQGNEVGARSLVEQVLEEDPSHVDALRLKALWLIGADETDEAIVLLRRALDQEPTNASVLSATAEAHLRNGERELANEMLALAVEASGRQVSESLDYARFLLGDERFSAAESVLVDALRITPDNVSLLVELGRVYVGMEDWARTEQVETALRDSEDPTAASFADRLRVAMLRAQSREADAIAFLETLAERDGGYRAAEIAIVRAHLERGDNDAALNYINELLTDAPDDPSVRFLLAAVSASSGDFRRAEQEYRSLIDTTGGQNERVWVELVRVLNASGRSVEAERVINQGLDAVPEAADLLWMRASLLEQRNEFEAAIEIYERLYESNTTTSVIANNLASLLSTARQDPESLDRAYVIARRLRNSDFPPFQDTYGWIAFRKGEMEEALRHLEPAASALVTDPLVQYHLGRTYHALERFDEAHIQFQRSLELAGDREHPAFDIARNLIAEMDNSGNPAPNSGQSLDNLPQPSLGGVGDN